MTAPAPAPRSVPPLALLAGLSGLGTMTLTMAVPVLPAIQGAFGVSYPQIVLAQTAFLLGMALPQVFFGPLSDRFGRRRALVLGLLVYVAGSVFAGMADNPVLLAFGRLMQASGACAGVTVSRAVLRDVLPPDRAASGLARITMAMVVIPMLAPIVGGAIADALGWRAVFWTCTGLGAALLAVVLVRLPETGGAAMAARNGIVAGVRTVIVNRVFLRFALTVAFGSCLFQIGLSAGPSLFGREVSSATLLGAFFLPSSVTYFCANWVAANHGAHIGLDRLVLFGAIGSFSIALLLVAGQLLFGPALVLFFAAVGLFGGSQGLLIASAVSRAVGAVGPSLAGTASGLAGCLQFSIAGLASLLAGHAAVIGFGAVAACFLFCATVSLLILTRFPR